jgi:alpha-mannosidase
MIQNWTGYVGQWDNRLWLGEVPELASQWHNEWGGLAPGYVKPSEVAWFATHRHHPTEGNEYYQFSYIYKYALDLPDGARSITLPSNDRVKILAVTVVKGDHNQAAPLRPLHDTLGDHTLAEKPGLTVNGALNDMCTVSIDQPLYWKQGGLHYTTDGSEPTEQSAVYTSPIALYSAATIKAKAFLSSDQTSETADIKVAVNDVTPPSVKSAMAFTTAPTMYVEFSEPVEKDSAERPENYALAGGAKVESAQLWESGKMVTLELGAPVDPASELTVSHVKDRSPAANAMKSQQVSIALIKPVFEQSSGSPGNDATPANLPVHGTDPWTINLMLKVDRQPPNRTLIAGFGRARDDTGHGRYLAKFANGIHFWGSKRDAETNTQLDVKKWQMLTVTYDGKTVRIYKNGEPIGQESLAFEDDDSAVHIAPIDPWDNKRMLEGQVRDMTVWNVALPQEALAALWKSADKE